MDKIVPSFSKSLFAGVKHTIGDMTEFGIDSLLDEGLFKEFPIVEVLVGVKNTVQNLYDRNLLRQTLQFIKEFNSGTINNKKLENYRKKINLDSKKGEEELGRVLLILNKTIELKKSEMIAKLFKKYIDKYIKWDEFCEFSTIVDGIFIRDILVLGQIHSSETKESKDYPVFSINRLKSLGLIDTSDIGGFSFVGRADNYAPANSNIGFTKIGVEFYNCITVNIV